MHGYKDFSKDVRSIFKDIISKYSLNILEESEYAVVLKSKNCMIQISAEFTYVELAFKENENDEWMILGPYLSALFPNEKITITDNSDMVHKDAIKSSLYDMLNIIQRFGEPILSGDFSWVDEYNKHI